MQILRNIPRGTRSLVPKSINGTYNIRQVAPTISFIATTTTTTKCSTVVYSISEITTTPHQNYQIRRVFFWDYSIDNMTFRTAFLGEEGKYDYWSMCMPSNPFRRGEKTPLNFYGKGN